VTVRALLIACAAVAAGWGVYACASAGAPPGGPPDLKPPLLVRIAPDSGAVRVKPGDVEFEFDEVVGETPRGSQTLSQIVLVSPSDGDPVVGWHRNSITVHPRHGWRENTTYVVTLLPGMLDLRGNASDSTKVLVFSTGDSIPVTRVTGTIFDWTKGTPAMRAFVEAHPVGDTTIAYPAKADSIGRFVLPFLRAGKYVVRAILDLNNNRRLDAREAWDSVAIELRDVTPVELYTFVHDTLHGPRISTVSVLDSVTLRIAFDLPLSPVPNYLPGLELRHADSSAIATNLIAPWPVLSARRDSIARVVRDSIANADTNTVVRARREQARRDSVERAAAVADSLARDTTKRVLPPKPSRPTLISEIGVELKQPLVPGAQNFVRATARGVLGPEQISLRSFSLPKPAPAARGGAGGRADSADAKGRGGSGRGGGRLPK
jgi:hypothetical protein